MAASASQIERVYRERFAGFRRALATITGSQDSARDCVQEAFARALAERGRFRGGSLEAWIWRIALDRARDVRRRTRPDALGARLPPARLPDEDAAHPALVAALRELPPRRRLVVFLHYWADLRYADIAEALDISEGTVAATLAQARAALHDELTRPEEVPA